MFTSRFKDMPILKGSTKPLLVYEDVDVDFVERHGVLYTPVEIGRRNLLLVQWEEKKMKDGSVLLGIDTDKHYLLEEPSNHPRKVLQY